MFIFLTSMQYYFNKNSKKAYKVTHTYTKGNDPFQTEANG